MPKAPRSGGSRRLPPHPRPLALPGPLVVRPPPRPVSLPRPAPGVLHPAPRPGLPRRVPLLLRDRRLRLLGRNPRLLLTLLLGQPCRRIPRQRLPLPLGRQLGLPRPLLALAGDLRPQPPR